MQSIFLWENVISLLSAVYFWLRQFLCALLSPARSHTALFSLSGCSSAWLLRSCCGAQHQLFLYVLLSVQAVVEIGTLKPW